MSSVTSADNDPIVSREDAGNGIGGALRLFVGRGRRYSVKQLSNGTGVPDRLIECAMVDPDDAAYRPLKPEHLLSLARFLGTPFTSEWLQLAGQGAFELPDADAEPLAVLVADSASGTSSLAGIAADANICARDRAEMKAVGHRDIRRGIRLLAMAGGRARAKLHDIFGSAHWPRLRRVS